MSAFLCSDLHVFTLAAHGQIRGFGDALNIARELRATNNRAMACRYGDKPVPLRSIRKGVAAAIDAQAANPYPLPTIAGCLQCFEYQCSEGDAMNSDGPSSEGAAFIRGMRAELERLKVKPAAGIWAL